MLRREACIGQLLNTSILTGCVTWFSMLLTPDSPTKLLRKPGSRPWLALPLKSEASGWASASVGLARGGWSLGAGATAAPAGLCYRGCPCPQPEESQDGRWYEEKMCKWQWQVLPLNQRPGRQAGWSLLAWPSYWDQPYYSQLCSFRKLLWLSVLIPSEIVMTIRSDTCNVRLVTAPE